MVTTDKREVLTTAVIGLIAPAAAILAILVFPVFGPMGIVLLGWPISFYLPIACGYLLIRLFLPKEGCPRLLCLVLAIVNVALFVFLAARDLIFWLNWFR
jgi:membrane-bound acyltransferase YfiQ involved in biofilm formation